MIIYKITNQINGKVYIGQTVRTLSERFKEHARKKSYLGNAIKKYGKGSFTVEKIDQSFNVDDLNAKEIFWIKEYNSLMPSGYNLCFGGGNTMGYNHKESSKIMMATKKEGMYKKEENPFYGKKHTKETREKMRKAWDKNRKEKLAEDSRIRNPINQAVRVRNVETGEIFDSVKSAAEAYGLKDTHITRVCRGKRKRTGGYHWEYVDKTIPSQADENQKV